MYSCSRSTARAGLHPVRAQWPHVNHIHVDLYYPTCEAVEQRRDQRYLLPST